MSTSAAEQEFRMMLDALVFDGRFSEALLLAERLYGERQISLRTYHHVLAVAVDRREPIDEAWRPVVEHRSAITARLV